MDGILWNKEHNKAHHLQEGQNDVDILFIYFSFPLEYIEKLA